MVIMMVRLMDTSHKEGLAAMLVLLVVMAPVLAASLLLYLILISKLIILSIIVMTIIVSLLIKHYYYLNTKVELRERTKRTKQLFQLLSASFRQMTSVQSR